MQKIKGILAGHKRLTATLIIIAVLLFAAWKFFGPKGPSASQYQTAPVERATIVTSVSASGNILSANFIPVTTQAGGTVATVYVKNGDQVVSGQKIMDLTLDRTGAQKNAAAYASYLSAQASANSAQAKLNSLQSTMFKANQTFLNDRGVQNPTDADKADPKYIEENADWLQAEADYKNQQTVIAQSQSALNSAALSLAQSSPQITAPADGVIDSITYVPGMVITSQTNSTANSNTDQRVAVIRNDKAPVASVNVSEVDVYKIQAGQRVTLTLDSIVGKTFTGKVVSIDRIGSTTSNVTNYPALIQFDTGNDQILPNMAVTANIMISSKDNVLLVPNAAVQTQNGQSSIRVLRNGQPFSVDVQTGLTSDTQTEIVSGDIKEGDEVITGTTTPNTSSGTPSRSVFGGAGFGGGGFGGGGGVRVQGGNTRRTN